MSINIEEYLDQRRWLMSNGIFTEDVKNNIYLYGMLTHKDIRAVEVSIDGASFSIEYNLYMDKSLMEAYTKYNILKDSKSLFDLWKTKRILKKHGNLEFTNVLNKFIRDYCGPRWKAKVNLALISEYKDEPSNTEEDRVNNEV